MLVVVLLELLLELLLLQLPSKPFKKVVKSIAAIESQGRKIRFFKYWTFKQSY